jgi:hypothetical protein
MAYEKSAEGLITSELILHGKSWYAVFMEADFVQFYNGGLAKLVPHLSSQAQFSPSSFKLAKAVPHLYLFVQIRPCADVALHGGSASEQMCLCWLW